MSLAQNEKSSSPLDLPSEVVLRPPPTWPAVLVAMLSAFLVIVPMLLRGNPFGHDLEFHLSSWLEAARQWHEGTLYPRWAAWPNYGLGEPRFIFYPPVSWTLGAALGTILTWRIALGAFSWLTLTLAGISMHRLARESLGPRESLWAAALYAANPYAILLIYVRCAFAELLASALFPLVVLAALRLGRSPRRDVLLLAGGTAAMWLVNAPSAVITCYAVALLLALRAIRERTARPLLLGAPAFALGLALAAFYILPAAYEQRWVHIAAALRTHLRTEDNFLFTVTLSPLHKRLNLLVSALASAEIALFVPALLVARKVEGRPRGVLILLGTLGSVAALLMFRPAAFAWRLLPWMRFVQFPWRVLFVLSLALVFSLVVAAPAGWAGRAWRIGLVAAWIFLGGFLLGYTDFNPSQLQRIVAAVKDGTGYRGTSEYTPLAGDWQWMQTKALAELAVRGPLAGPPGSVRLDSGAAVTAVTVEASSAADYVFSVETPEPLRLPLKLIGYPAWQVEINETPAAVETLPQTGQIAVSVPAGQSRVRVHFARTRDRAAGAAISICAIVVALGVLLAGRKAQTA